MIQNEEGKKIKKKDKEMMMMENRCTRHRWKRPSDNDNQEWLRALRVGMGFRWVGGLAMGLYVRRTFANSPLYLRFSGKRKKINEFGHNGLKSRSDFSREMCSNNDYLAIFSETNWISELCLSHLET